MGPAPDRSRLQVISDEEFAALRTNGIKVNYWAVCPRKLWLFAKGVRLEAASDRVLLGRLLHENAYARLPRREVMLDELVRVDVLEGQGRVLEIKHSRRLLQAARLQVGYYLLYLRHLGAGDLVGELRFPKERRREEVHLTPELEAQVAEALRGVARVEALPSPPRVEYMSICRACAYAELCWG
ncbi:MAG TPA: CRISPR-associated protein Cas4 [Dehalococcoidia bacterium]|nr:CRISPR-associated protein Cas4 [Dehalococcoidia bacterium]